LADIKNFLSQSVTAVNWVVIVINGSENVTPETRQVMKDIFSFLDLATPTTISSVVFCVTHTEGWNWNRKCAFHEELKSSIPQIQEFFEIGVVIFEIGAIDPDELEEGEYRDIAKKLERRAHQELMHMVPLRTNSILGDLINRWKGDGGDIQHASSRNNSSSVETSRLIEAAEANDGIDLLRLDSFDGTNSTAGQFPLAVRWSSYAAVMGILTWIAHLYLRSRSYFSRSSLRSS